MSYSFKGKRALVTGAGKSIGRGLAKKLVESGAETFALSRTLSDLESLKEECPSIHIIQCDLNDTSSIESKIKSCLPIDFLVNNAGMTIDSAFLDFSVESYDKIMNINLKAPFLISQIVGRDLVNRKTNGSIVNLSSIVSQRAAQNYSVYGIAKAGVDQMTRTMALELAPHNIRVNTVQPTATRTHANKHIISNDEICNAMIGKIPMGRIGEIHEVNALVLFLLSDQASLITGSCMPVDGGSLCYW